MSFYNALAILLEEGRWLDVALVVGIVTAIYVALFRRRFSSIFDPLVYVLLLSSIASSVLLLLGRYGLVSISKIAFVAGTLALFYAGFLLTDLSARRRRPLPPPRLGKVQDSTLAVLFIANSAVLCTTYAVFGIPLFLEARLAQFVDSGGFGVLGRLATGLEFPMLVMAFIALSQRRHRRGMPYAVLVQFIVSAILSGSKGSILTAVFAWYVAHVCATRSWSQGLRLPRPMIAFFVFVVLSPLLVIAIQNPEDAGDFGAVLQRLAIRFAAEGDAYAYFLGDDAIDTVARHDWIAPLRQPLAALRLVPAETSINPGFEIIREVLDVDSPSSGPNSRLPIYLMFFYGSGGIVLAPLAGMALGLSRNALARSTARGPVKSALLAAVYFHCCRLEVDPQLTVAGLFGLLLAGPLFWIAAVSGRPPRVRTRAETSNPDPTIRPHVPAA